MSHWRHRWCAWLGPCWCGLRPCACCRLGTRWLRGRSRRCCRYACAVAAAGQRGWRVGAAGRSVAAGSRHDEGRLFQFGPVLCNVGGFCSCPLRAVRVKLAIERVEKLFCRFSLGRRGAHL